MANRCNGGPQCPYGYGHEQEHRDAAIKGWETRRRHGAARYVESSFGGKYKLHYHPGGPGTYPHYMMQDIDDPSAMFELSADEFWGIAREVRARERSKVEQKSLFDRANNARLRAEAAAEKKRERERARHNRDRLIFEARAEREAERERRRGALWERNELYRSIREYVPSGIKPYRGDHEREEYTAVPRQLRAKRGERYALTLDDAALQLSESAPWLQINSADDLTQAFNRVAMAARNERSRRRSA